MASLAELDQRIAIVRDNIRELTEQAAAYSGAQDELPPPTALPSKSGRFRNCSRNARRLSTARVRGGPELWRVRPRGSQAAAATGAGSRSPSAQRAKSCCARAESARLRASPRSGPARRFPAALKRGSAIGGNRPKLTFIGWNERGPASIDSMWPPVMWLRSAPIAVVGGGGSSSAPSRSAAARRPAMRPTAALST